MGFLLDSRPCSASHSVFTEEGTPLQSRNNTRKAAKGGRMDRENWTFFDWRPGNETWKFFEWDFFPSVPASWMVQARRSQNRFWPSELEKFEAACRRREAEEGRRVARGPYL